MQLHLRPPARATALVGAAVLAAMLLGGAPTAAFAAGPEAGSVRFTRAAESEFDRYTISPSAASQAFMRQRFWRMRTYAPYFDERLSWYPDAWTYLDLYAIYRDDDLAEEHPEWILRDAAGRRLFIPFDCGGGSCTQYAGDIGDPAFRAHWIAGAKAQAAGYRGLFVDDVNLEPRVSDGHGDHVMPLDERTGRTMTDADWRRYMGEFTEQIAAAFPRKEIVHNALWFVGHRDPGVRRQLKAATHIEIERGVNDPGLTGGGGQFGYETLLEHIDWLHSKGKGVVLDSYADSRTEVEYELASYFLVSSGRDGVGTGWRSAPGDWWPGYGVKLGSPRGSRYEWRGLLRRDFERGFVLVNRPGRAPTSVDLGAGSLDPTGAPRSSVVLSAAEGAIVLEPRARAARRRVTTTRTRVRSDVLAGGPLRRAVLVHGLVRRARGRGGVLLRLQRRTRGSWVGVRTRRTPLRRAGRFRRVFAGVAPGRYRVLAVYRGSRKTGRSRAIARFALPR